MALCGSRRCGCGIVSTPATEGAIGGQLPSIQVSGSGEAGDPYDLKLNDLWAENVVGTIATLGAGLVDADAAIDVLEGEMDAAQANIISVQGNVGTLLTGGTGVGPTSDTAGIGGTPFYVPGMSVTWTAVAGQRYRVSGVVQILKTTDSIVEVTIQNAANGTLWQSTPFVRNNDVAIIPFDYSDIPGAGSHTRKIALRSASGTLTYIGTFLRQGYIFVTPVS